MRGAVESFDFKQRNAVVFCFIKWKVARPSNEIRLGQAMPSSILRSAHNQKHGVCGFRSEKSDRNLPGILRSSGFELFENLFLAAECFG